MINIVNSNQGKVQIRKKTNLKPTSTRHRVKSCKPCSFYTGRVSYQHRVNGPASETSGPFTRQAFWARHPWKWAPVPKLLFRYLLVYTTIFCRYNFIISTVPIQCPTENGTSTYYLRRYFSSISGRWVVPLFVLVCAMVTTTIKGSTFGLVDTNASNF